MIRNVDPAATGQASYHNAGELACVVGLLSEIDDCDCSTEEDEEEGAEHASGGSNVGWVADVVD